MITKGAESLKLVKRPVDARHSTSSIAALNDLQLQICMTTSLPVQSEVIGMGNLKL